jgi:uridine kinase
VGPNQALPCSVGSAKKRDELVYEKLPADIAERHVLLLDPVLGTGNTALRAVKVLLDKGVREERIMLLTLIASRHGIQEVMTKRPDIKIITSEIDRDIDSNFRVVPGVGEFGDRYFCQ